MYARTYVGATAYARMQMVKWIRLAIEFPGSHAMCWTVLVLPHTDCKSSFSNKLLQN